MNFKQIPYPAILNLQKIWIFPQNVYDTERSGSLEFKTVFGTELPHAIMDRSVFDTGFFNTELPTEIVHWNALDGDPRGADSLLLYNLWHQVSIQ